MFLTKIRLQILTSSVKSSELKFKQKQHTTPSAKAGLFQNNINTVAADAMVLDCMYNERGVYFSHEQEFELPMPSHN